MLSQPVIATAYAQPKRWWNRLKEKWNEVQVGRQGSYSVERLESFDRYCKTTSLVRVILVCVLTPLPALCFAILLEFLPLRPPSEGWAANWMFWIRLAITTPIMTFAGISQLVALVPDVNPTFRKLQLIAWGQQLRTKETFCSCPPKSHSQYLSCGILEASFGDIRSSDAVDCIWRCTVPKNITLSPQFTTSHELL
ncbi:unnamed protein product [Phytophthora lilii]|uniref:Unnamed protein product n=1 Tax=Phytophthora lilii TaxID=2077276 RepID=A0A9W6WUR1_9STRA|nr:unnamed protein product [Phytophthora lilii]